MIPLIHLFSYKNYFTFCVEDVDIDIIPSYYQYQRQIYMDVVDVDNDGKRSRCNHRSDIEYDYSDFR